MSSSKCAQEGVKNVKGWLKERERKLPVQRSCPLPTSHCPKLDVSPELDADDADRFQSVVAAPHWAVGLGQARVAAEASTLSSHLALPHEGHLVCAHHVFAHLEKRHDTQTVFHPTCPVIDQSVIPTHDWTNFHGNVREAIPLNASTPLSPQRLSARR
jgi:hypothetical protein